eukprot:m.400166 g.400166  ORF g.400166 m.400166 type:complete len:72 (+) comp21157_c0_seq17:2218-2433(+)
MAHRHCVVMSPNRTFFVHFQNTTLIGADARIVSADKQTWSSYLCVSGSTAANNWKYFESKLAHEHMRQSIR